MATVSDSVALLELLKEDKILLMMLATDIGEAVLAEKDENRSYVSIAEGVIQEMLVPMLVAREIENSNNVVRL
jgi:hypothetical protein